MIHPKNLALLEAARAGLIGDRWDLHEADNRLSIKVTGGGTASALTLMHDGQTAPTGDLLFVAAAREDFDFLVDSLGGTARPSSTRLREIRERIGGATAGPWKHYLESEGGLGGSNVITMGGSESDLYVLLDGHSAPDSEWRFIALAHEEFPSLLIAVESIARGDANEV